MTTPNTEEKTEPPKTEGQPPAEPPKTPAAPAPAAPGTAPKAEPPKTETPTEAPKQAAPKILDAETDEIPENEELFQLSKKALNARLARHTKRELQSRFGSDDPDEIKTRLDKLAIFESEAETRRIANLSEVEKANEKATKAEERATKAEEALQRSVDSQVFSEYDTTAAGAIEKYVDPKYTKFAIPSLKAHVMALDEADLKDPGKVFDAWAQEFAKEHPELAKKAEKAEEPTKPEPKKIALNTGAHTTRPEKENPNLAQKTPRPGQPNSMTNAEYAAWKRGRGLHA